MEKNKRDLLSHLCFFFLETKIEIVLGINLIKSILQLNINESPFDGSCSIGKVPPDLYLIG